MKGCLGGVIVLVGGLISLFGAAFCLVAAVSGMLSARDGGAAFLVLLIGLVAIIGGAQLDAQWRRSLSSTLLWIGIMSLVVSVPFSKSREMRDQRLPEMSLTAAALSLPLGIVLLWMERRREKRQSSPQQ
jgi:hypothetical protein